MSCNTIRLRLSQNICRASKIFRRGTQVSYCVGVTLCLYVQKVHFHFDYLCGVTAYDIIFADVVQYIIQLFGPLLSDIRLIWQGGTDIGLSLHLFGKGQPVLGEA